MANALTAALLRLVADAVRENAKYLAEVVDVDGDEQIQFREVGAATASSQYYPRIEGTAIVAGDIIEVLGRKDPIVQGKVIVP